MARYSPERRETVLRKLLPPHNVSVAELARQEGISKPTLYAWRKQVKAGGAAVPGDQKRAADWSAEAKLAVVIETAALSEVELSEYCRKKGLYPQDIRAWREACLLGQAKAGNDQQREREQSRADKKRIKELERELKRKDKALAEAAAILVLRKKLSAYWGDDSEEN